MILKDAFVSLNGVSTNRVKEVKIPFEYDAKDNTAMGNNTKRSEPGLIDNKVSLTF